MLSRPLDGLFETPSTCGWSWEWRKLQACLALAWGVGKVGGLPWRRPKLLSGGKRRVMALRQNYENVDFSSKLVKFGFPVFIIVLWLGFARSTKASAKG